MIGFKQRASLTAWLQCKRNVILVSCFWLLGLIFGLCFVSSENKLLSNLVYYLPYNQITIPGCLITAILPFIITVTAIHISMPLFIYIYAAFKAFSFSCVICGIVIAYGSSGWLIQLLLLFSDSFVVLLLLWLWYNYLNQKVIGKDIWICTAISAGISMIDYFLVSPYLAMLMNYS